MWWATSPVPAPDGVQYNSSFLPSFAALSHSQVTSAASCPLLSLRPPSSNTVTLGLLSSPGEGDGSQETQAQPWLPVPGGRALATPCLCQDPPPVPPLPFVQLPTISNGSQIKGYPSRDPKPQIASGSRTLEIRSKCVCVFVFFWN